MDVKLEVCRPEDWIQVKAMALPGYDQAVLCAAGRFDRTEKAWRFPAKAERAVRNLNKRFFGVEGDEPVVEARLHIKEPLACQEGPIVVAGCVLSRATPTAAGDGFVVRCGDQTIYEEGRPSAGHRHQSTALSDPSSVQWVKTWESRVNKGSVILVEAPRQRLETLPVKDPRIEVEFVD